MLGTVKNIATTLIAVLQTRLELVGNELQVQKLLLIKQLGLVAGLVFCVVLSVPLAIALAVANWWDYRVLVLGISTGVAVLAGIICFVLLMRTLRTTEAAFAASVAALRDDLAVMRASTSRIPHSARASGMHE